MLIKIIKYLAFRGYKKKLSSFINDDNIERFLPNPLIKNNICYFKVEGDFSDLKRLLGKKFIVYENDIIKFEKSIDFNYFFWLVDNIYKPEEIRETKLIYKNFSLSSIDKEVIKSLPDIRFYYFMNRVMNRLPKVFTKKPDGISYEEWLIAVSKISIYCDFYITNNFPYFIKRLENKVDTFEKYYSDIVSGYNYLKLYWRFFD